MFFLVRNGSWGEESNQAEPAGLGDRVSPVPTGQVGRTTGLTGGATRGCAAAVGRDRTLKRVVH